ncbi:MAG TPA: lysylphosphatidylglycerol synthase transmembrane domain-containing protein, partial [Acidimicrobiia bacterium]|nr:lysylphosphatidylglycerol synthase transmembrane domain-containing protein [Acidimicrobiia bacterium]
QPSRMAAWRAHSFGPASEQPYRRRTSDWVRLLIGAAIFAFAIWHENDPTQFEKNLFTTLNGLPNELDSLFRLIYSLGALWALGLVIIAALVMKRWRLARDLAVGGLVTWALARIVGALVVSDSSLVHSLDTVVRIDRDAPGFPAVRVAIIVAVISVASPYVTRPVRRLGQMLVLLMAIASLYLGATLPDGALAAVALGWTIAALVHLVFGSPGGRPTAAQVQATLVDLGVDATDVQLVPHQPTTGTLMSAHDERGDLVVRVLGRDEADAQLMSKCWRALAYKDGGPALHTTRLEDVEAQAYAMLLAERAGVDVPPVVVAGTAGPGTALIALRPLPGSLLCDLGGESVTDAMLDDLWKQVAALHAARVAHGRLNCNHVFVDGARLGIADFECASGAAATGRRAADVAELLVSTALVVGDDRAVAAARSGLGDDAIIEALPYLQPAALSRDLRTDRRHRKERSKQVESVRVAAAAATGTDEPPLQELHRVSGTNLMMAIGTLIAVFALLSQVGSPQVLWDTITDADIGWLIVAMIISLLTNFATAIALMGTVPINLPLIRTAELQLSMSFSNLAVPAIGGMAAQIRFLQKQGVDLASAVASGGLLINVGNIVAQVMLLGVALLLAPTKIHVEPIDTQKLLTLALAVLVVLVVAVGLILGIPKLRNYVVPPTKAAAATVWAAVRSPRRVALLLGGNAVNALMYAGVYMACISAFGGSINFWTLLSLNIIISTLASLVPIPGGNTAVSSVGMSGALAAVGVPTDIAVAAVLADQLVSSFLPAVPGWWATNNLLHDDYL